jgi:flagellar hook-associated protein 3 FlgL
MRISTAYLYQNGVSRLSELQASIARTQQQMSSNRRVLTPSDDPVAASRALEISQSKAINERLTISRQDARAALTYEENSLDGIGQLLQDVKTGIVGAGNGSLDDAQRKFIAADMRSRLDNLIGLANARDGEGNYLFGGNQGGTQPHVRTGGGVQYNGDQGVHSVQVGPARVMAVSDSGNAIFGSIPLSNAIASQPAAANTGSGQISGGAVSNSTLLTGHTYSIDISGGGTSFAVYDLTLDPGKSAPLPASGAYSSGSTITFDGLSVTLSGTVNDGDAFAVQPAGAQSVFTTMDNLIKLLETPISTPADQATYTYGLRVAGDGISNAMDRVSTVRASVGSRLNELDMLDGSGEDLNIQYQTSLGLLQDIDLAKAISDLAQQSTTLQAAQQSFVKVSQLSLFNFLS